MGLNWADYVSVDPHFFRPAEVTQLRGDASKAKKVLGWKPEVTFKQLVSAMVEADVERIGRQISGSRRAPIKNSLGMLKGKSSLVKELAKSRRSDAERGK